MNSPDQASSVQLPPRVSHWPRAQLRRALQAVLLIAVGLLGGCRQKVERPALATYPVTGRIVTTGKMPVGGCVQFEPTQNGADYVAQGVIGSEGQFSLQVPYVDRVLPGATEGPHTARLLMPLRDGGMVVPIAGSFAVKRADNDFTIEMPKMPAG